MTKQIIPIMYFPDFFLDQDDLPESYIIRDTPQVTPPPTLGFPFTSEDEYLIQRASLEAQSFMHTFSRPSNHPAPPPQPDHL